MRGTVAKRLRRKVLGPGYSTKSAKEYVVDKTGAIRCRGKRAEYQRAKKEYNRLGV